jgi:hypothetical protein
MKSFLEAQMKYRPLSFEPRQARRPVNRLATWKLIAIVGLLLSIASAVPAFAQIVGTVQLNVERRGHTAILLEDGKVLIVGGDNQNGIVSQAEIFDPVSQTSALAATPVAVRTDHTATRLSDGRVLVIGGRDQNSSLTSTEIYNPLTATFTAGPSLTTPRSGHTATLLSDGKILVAGGDASGSAELYNPATESFSLIAGSMNTARKFHSAILTSSGQVLIVGGVNAQNVVLNTAEVFDPASQSFYLPPTDMQTPRALATLKLLADGKVQIIGGDAELSMEVFDPTNGIFIAKALLPPNADLLGATLSTQSRAALFSPLVVQDPLLQGVMTPEQSALLDRADHSITELPSRNQAFVAGGINSAGQILNSAKLVSSSSASITTDKTDYAPGQIVTITGSGFQPNEQVNIYFHEFPEEYPDIFLSALANQQGNFVAAEFAPHEIDVGRVFTLTAIGQSSSRTAQTAFKDNKNLTVTKAGTGMGTVTSAPSSLAGGGSISCNAACTSDTEAFADTDTVTLTATPASGSVFGGWSFSSSAGNGPPTSPSPSCNSAGTTCSFGMNNKKQEVTATFNTVAATATSISAPTITYDANGSVTVTVSSAAGTPTGNVILSVDGGPPVSKVLSGGTVTFINTDIAALTSPNAGDHSLSASYAAQGNFAASSATGNLRVNQASSSTAVTFENGPYTYRGTAFTATAVTTGVGGLNQVVAVVYTGDCTNVTGPNGCTATATFGGDTNHASSSDSKSITINQALSLTAVTCPASVTYNGAAQTPCSATVTGAGSLNQSLTVNYTNNINTGMATASASYPGDTNHTASNDSKNFNIEKVAVTATAGGGSATYDGTTKSPSACTVTGAYTGDLTCANNPVSVGPDTGTTPIVPVLSGTGLTNFNVTSVNGSYIINQAPSVTTVTVSDVTYDGSAHGGTANVTGAGGLNQSLTVSYSGRNGTVYGPSTEAPTNAGDYTASASFAGDVNHNGSDDSKNFTIEKAATVTTLTCGAGPFIYNGNPHTPCSASVSGPGLNESLTVNYMNNVNAGTATASASYAESANYLGSTGMKNFTIEKAASVTTVTCPASINYNGSAQTPCSATATGAGSLNQSLPVSYSNNINTGIATANASFAGDTNHNGSSSSATFIINKVDPTCAVNGFNGMYDSAAHGATGSCTGVGGASDVLAGLNLGSSFTNVPGGTANWTFNDLTGNYNNKSGSVNVVINQRPASVTPNAASKIYGDVDPAFSGTLTGFLPADGVTATYSRTAGETVGNYTISATLSPAGVLGNYNITYNTANFTITYGVCLLFDNSKAVQKNSTVPIKLNLCGVNGVNVSSSAVVLAATNLVWSGSESAPEVQDSGNANPDDNFRFTGGSYMFNLSTKNLWSGKWGLEFRANGDPLSHVVIFNVR